MTVTGDQLAERIDPALAVERALTAAERVEMTERVLFGSMNGAEPADWISEAENADAYLGTVEPWLEQHSQRCTAVLAAAHELPEQLTRRLYVSALYACIGTGVVTGEGPDRTNAVYALADRAALWARGYAEAYGWVPA